MVALRRGQALINGFGGLRLTPAKAAASIKLLRPSLPEGVGLLSVRMVWFEHCRVVWQVREQQAARSEAHQEQLRQIQENCNLRIKQLQLQHESSLQLLREEQKRSNTQHQEMLEHMQGQATRQELEQQLSS